MGLAMKCPKCNEPCDQEIFQQSVIGDYECLLVQCSTCKHVHFVMIPKIRSQELIKECPKCGSLETGIDEGPWIYDDCMKFKQSCFKCGHMWTGLYGIPERIGVKEESDPPED